MNNEFLQTEEAIVAMLKTVYDPEIPVNVFDPRPDLQSGYRRQKRTSA